MFTNEFEVSILRNISSILTEDKHQLGIHYEILVEFLFRNKNNIVFSGFIDYHNYFVRFLKFSIKASNFTIPLLEAGVSLPENISGIFYLYEEVLLLDTELLLTTVLEVKFSEEFPRIRITDVRYLNDII